MKRPAFCSLLRCDSGQAIVVCAVALTAMLGIGGFALDAGRAYFAYRQLQASTDAAALAGAKTLPTSTATVVATSYSGINGAANAVSTIPNVTMVPGYPKVLCLTTLQNQGMACVAPGNGNAVAVKQTVTIPTYFMKVIGKQNVTLTASSTASMRGGTPTPYNVALVLDSTLSMNIADTNCSTPSMPSPTQMDCALSGVRILLQSLTPCARSLSTCSVTNGVAANAVDQVAIFAFPNVTVGTAGIDANCTTPVPAPTSANGYYNLSPYGNFTFPTTAPWPNIPTAVPYSYPVAGAASYLPSGASTPTYQITNFLSDYRTSNSATSLNSSSSLVKAAGGVSGCGGMLPPNYDIIYETYYAAAIYAAQAALVAQAAQNPGTQNVLIFLSDGDANDPNPFSQYGYTYTTFPAPATSSGFYPSWVGQCAQGVAAAHAATAGGTRVYSVAYGSPQSGCSTDQNAGQSPNITPCQAMASIASAPQYFFSDYLQSNTNSTCQSTAQVGVSLSQIFTHIANDLTVGRLIPDNTP